MPAAGGGSVVRWRTGTRSGNVEDRRGIPGGRGGGLGIAGIIVLIGLALVLGIDPLALLGSTDLSPAVPAPQSSLSQEEQDLLADNATLVLGDAEKTWAAIFEDQLGKTYEEPKLVLFTGGVDSACGYAGAAAGPFYCPADRKVYLDLDFFAELDRRYGAPGDFAQAYVITHEIGHHVQTLLGTTQYVSRKSRQVSETEANRLSVALELQADCYAGVWANRAQYQDLILEKGDLEEALNAANAIGDDTLQKEAQGYVVPDSFTHGTSAERVAWFRRGMDSGQVSACANPLLPAVT